MSEDGKLSIEEVAKYFRLSAEEVKKLRMMGTKGICFVKRVRKDEEIMENPV